MTDSIGHTKKAMIEALEKSLGIVSTAAKQVGISRDTHYRWMSGDEDYKAEVEELSEVALDFVESQLFKQIKEGNTAASIFYLKTKGKKRGYIERDNSHGMEEYIKILANALQPLPETETSD